MGNIFALVKKHFDHAEFCFVHFSYSAPRAFLQTKVSVLIEVFLVPRFLKHARRRITTD